MSALLQPGTIVDDRYVIESRLGSGGMADVYLALDQELQRKVALKLLHGRFARDEEFVERFRREASAAAGLQHAHVVSVYDRGRHDDTYYIAMEHLHGRTLKQLVQQLGPLDPVRAIDLTLQILRAARFAHRRGVIHRDIKPHNVIVDDEDRATVTDFGIARAGASEMTQTGSVMGTAQYLSPEQAQGHAVGAQSDLYAVGVVLYELLTGRVPFEGETAVAIALKQVGEAPVPPSAYSAAITPQLEQVVLCALQKDPMYRFADAEAFIAALEAARPSVVDGAAPTEATIVGIPVAPPPPPPVLPATPIYASTAPDRPRRRWWLLVLAALLLVGAVLAALLLGRAERVRVPDVVGRSEQSARATLRRAHFHTSVRRSRSDSTAGKVLSQDPTGGGKADKGSLVTLTVSAGPLTVAVPPVDGLSAAQAQKALEQLKFDVRVKRVSSPVSQGNAVRTVPGSGKQAPIGSRIVLEVSSGPEQVTVPALTGKSLSDARAALSDAGFTVGTVTETEDDKADPGTVLTQSPAAQAQAAKGSAVALTVAKAPAQLDVPDVVGQDEARAIAALEAAGVKVKRKLVEVTDEAQNGIVITQTPGPGKAKKRAKVTIEVGNYTPPPAPTPEPTPAPVTPDPAAPAAP